MVKKFDDLMVAGVELAKIGFYRYLFDGTILSFDQETFDFLELEGLYEDPESVIGKNIESMLIYTGQKGKLRKEIRKKGKLEGFEYQFKTLKGNEKWGIHNSFLLIDEKTGKEAVQVCFYDITERKQSELIQKELNIKWQTTFDAMEEAVFIVDRSGTVIEYNKVAKSSFSHKFKDIRGHKCWEIVHGSKKPLDECPVVKMWKSKRRETLQLQLNNRWYEITADPVLDEQGKITHAVHIMKDITEKRKMEEELRESKEALGYTLDGLGASIALVNTDGKILLVNKPWKDFATDNGIDPEKVSEGVNYFEKCKTSSGEWITEAKEFAEGLVDILAGKKSSHVFEYPCHAPNQNRWFTGRITLYSQNGSSFLIISHQNITERKLAEQTLLIEKEFTDTALNTQKDTFFLFEPKTGKAIRWNNAFRESSGYSDEEISNLPAPASYYSKEDIEKAASFIEQVFKEGTGKIDLELITKNGEKIPTEYNVSVIKDENNQPKYLISIGRDITERKQAEYLLRESNERLKLALQSASMGTWEWDIQKNHVIWSDETKRIFGVKNDNFGETYESYLNFTIPAQRDQVDESVKDFLKNSKNLDIIHYEHEIQKSDGSLAWIEVRGTLFLDNKNKPLRMTGICADITERKIAEEELQKLAAVVKHSGELVNIADLEGKMVFLNEAGSRMLGVDPQNVKNVNIMQVIPEHLVKLVKTELLPALMKGEIWEGDLQYKNLHTGNLTDVHAMTFTIKDPNTQNPMLLANVSLDITERKKAEAILNEKEERLRLTLEATGIGLWDWNMRDDIWYANPIYFTMLGYKVTDLGQNREVWGERVHPEDRERMINKMVEVRDFGIKEFDIEVRFRHANGSYRWINSIGKAIEFDGKGKAIRMLGLHIDITQRKQAEEILHHEKEKAQNYLNIAGVMIVAINRKGLITLINQKGAEILGYDQENIIGKNWFDTFIPSIQRKNVKSVFNKLIKGETEPVEYYENPVVTKNKDERIIAWHNTLLRDENDKINGTLSSGEDITDRKKAEMALRENQIFLQNIFDAIQDGISVLDSDLTVIKTNRWMEQMYNNSLPIPGQKCYEVYQKRQSPCSWCPAVRTLETAQSHTAIVPYPSEDNPSGWIELSTFPIVDAHNKVINIIEYVKDITDRKKIEQQIKENEERLRLALKSANQGLYDLNIQTGEAVVSPEYASMLGYDPETFVETNHKWIERLHPDDMEITAKIYKDYIEGKTDEYKVEFRQKMKSGDWKWILSMGKIAEHDSKGNPLRMLGTHTDISERKRIENEILATKEIYQKAIENARGVPYYLNYITNKYEFIGDNCKRVTGWDKRDLSLKKMKDIVSSIIVKDPKGPQDAREYGNLFKEGKINYYWAEMKFTTPNGELKWLSDRAIPIKDENTGKVIASLGIIQDITDSKISEEQLKIHDAEMTSLYQLSHSITSSLTVKEVVETSIEQVGKAISPDLILFFFCEENQMHLHGVRSKDDKIKADLKKHRVGECLCGLAVENRKPIYSEYIFKDPRCVRSECKKAGITSFAAFPLFHESKVIGIIGLGSHKHRDFKKQSVFLETLANDIAAALQNAILYTQIQNQTVELEKIVENRTAELQTANKELESFAYSVSHDLRAPLRAIDGFTRILMEDYVKQFDSEGKRLGSIIENNTKKMGQLIDDLLTFSRLGRSTMIFSSIDMKNMAKAIYFELTTREDRKKINFKLNSMPEIIGDTSMMRQVWINLISNALKFTANTNKPKIMIKAKEEKENVIYVIKDNGAGFDMRFHEKLFKVFQRLHSEKDFEGTGVGLALIQRIIKRHGGKIWAESEIDKGSTFFFSLPKK